MAKKEQYQQVIPQGKLLIKTVEEVMPESMLPYAEFVILDRALPRVEDGLKPVQRRILFTMHELGLYPDKPHKKSARIVGDCLGKYHPHGDSSVYDAMVRMAQPFNMRMTLVNGHGNFGSIDGDSAAAMRYTEARLEPLAMELLKDMDRETVPFSFNFDDSLLEPDLLPGRYPNLLVNGANGIAVGLATNIPTHNLTEVIDGACAYIDNPKISLEEMMKIVPGPDFSTGGYIITHELKQAYETGKGRITLRAKYSVEAGDAGKKLIVITELPYQTNKADLLRKIMLLKEDKKDLLSGIADIVDESDRQGMRAVIVCKKDADIDAILAVLFKNTDLECTFGINMVAIAGGRPRQIGLLDYYKYYTEYQRQVVLRRAKFDLKEAQARSHIVEGLIVGVHNIDEVIRIIKTSSGTTEARGRLMETFSLTQIQAQAILDLRLARLTKLEVGKLEEELKQLKEKIEYLKGIIGDKKKQFNVVKEEMKDIRRRFPCPRKTQIVQQAADIAVKRCDVKRAVTDWAVTITANNCLKFIEKAEFIKKSKKGLAANTTPSNLHCKTIYCKSDSKLLCFTDLGNVFAVELESIEPCEFKSVGVKLSDLCEGLQKGERVVTIKAVTGELPQGKLLFFTKDGMVKCTEWAEYEVNKKMIPAVKLKAGDKLINVENYDEDEFSTMLFVTKKGMVLNANKDEVPTQGRVAGGVKGMVLNDDDYVIFATQHTGEGEVLVINEKGMAKRVISSIIDPLPRARKGVLITDKNAGDLLFADYVTIPYALAVVQADKTTVELSTEQIGIENRVSKGKKLPGIEGDVQAVYSMKHKSEMADGMQMSLL